MPELPFLDHPLRNHEEVIARAREIGTTYGLAKVVVAAAKEDDVLAALYACKQEGIADAILVGEPELVKEALAIANVPEDTFELVATESDEESAQKSAEIAGSGQADVVMKGYLKTSTLLKTLLKHDYGLRDRELVSHSAVLFVPEYGKLLNITDGGTLIRPTIEQKLTVIANAFTVMRATGNMKPRIAVIGPDEAREDAIENRDTEKLLSIVREHWGEFLEIDGPFPFDMTVTDPTILGIPYTGTVAGDADVLITHTIEECNITAKTLIQFGGAIFMGVIAGAKVPISLVSRSDTMLNKKASVALAVCLADSQRYGFASLPKIDLNGGVQ